MWYKGEQHELMFASIVDKAFQMGSQCKKLTFSVGSKYLLPGI